VGFEVQLPDNLYPIDASLSVRSPDGKLHGRQSTRSLAVENDHLAFAYPLGDCAEIETHIWWNGAWQLHLHRYHIQKTCSLLLGGQSLASVSPHDLKESGSFPILFWTNPTYQAALHSLHGFAKADSMRVAGDRQPRTHIYAHSSLTPHLETRPLNGEGFVVALHGLSPKTIPLERWEIAETKQGCWTLKSKTSRLWQLHHSVLPAF
jgi:hypothetical protein